MKDDTLYLIHIGECIDRIQAYTAAGRETFLTSTLIQDAVIRNLQVLGESAKRLSPELKSAHPGVEWREAAALRNVLVHDYLGVDPDIVWSVVEHDLPRLKRAVDTLLGTRDDTGS